MLQRQSARRGRTLRRAGCSRLGRPDGASETSRARARKRILQVVVPEGQGPGKKLAQIEGGAQHHELPEQTQPIPEVPVLGEGDDLLARWLTPTGELKRRYVLAFFHWVTLYDLCRRPGGDVKRQKNYATDAAAICEAVARANMRFVPTKTPEQQSCRMLHTRHLFIRQQTVHRGGSV